MKIALLSGADKNAGDFLIVNRAKRLLSDAVPGCEMMEFKRNESLDPYLDSLNACDVVVFAGGPGYMQDVYPERMPLVNNLRHIKPPFFAMGMGAYTRTSSIKGYEFDKGSMSLLQRFERDGFSLGCRDELTIKVLNRAGLSDAVMTGCPAWYDLEKVGASRLSTSPNLDRVGHVAISDPALAENVPVACAVTRYVTEQLNPQKVTFVFHRGWSSDKFSRGYLAACQRNLKTWLDRQSVDVRSIAYSDEGFEVYDECDLHIGFRVHAHIYNLSERRPSFLIEEDGRGWGLDETLGLDHVGIPINGSLERRLRTLPSMIGNVEGFPLDARGEKAVSQLRTVLNNEMGSGYPKVRAAFEVMERSYSVMRSHLGKLA